MTISLENERTPRVGDRRWPVSYSEVSDIRLPPIEAHRPIVECQFRRQAIVAFESGWAVSVLWGSLTFSDNHDHFYVDDVVFTDEPECVEVGILWRDEGLIGDPYGYVAAHALNVLLITVSQWPSADVPGVRVVPFLR